MKRGNVTLATRGKKTAQHLAFHTKAGCNRSWLTHVGNAGLSRYSPLPFHSRTCCLARHAIPPHAALLHCTMPHTLRYPSAHLRTNTTHALLPALSTAPQPPAPPPCILPRTRMPVAPPPAHLPSCALYARTLTASTRHTAHCAHTLATWTSVRWDKRCGTYLACHIRRSISSSLLGSVPSPARLL